MYKYLFLSLMSIISFNSYSQSQFNQNTSTPYTGTIYKYTGADGKLYYTDAIPANVKNQVQALSGKSGVLQRIIEKELSREEYAENKQQEANEQEKILKQAEKIKNDQRLLNTYSSVKEIESMKKYEIEQIDIALQNDTNNINMLTERKNFIENEIRKNPKASQTYGDELKVVQSNLATSNRSMDRNKEMLVQREKKYDEEKKRYIEISQELNKPLIQEINRNLQKQ